MRGRRVAWIDAEITHKSRGERGLGSVLATPRIRLTATLQPASAMLRDRFWIRVDGS